MLYQLSYSRLERDTLFIRFRDSLRPFASPQGFEPWTYWLTANCSTAELRRRFDESWTCVPLLSPFKLFTNPRCRETHLLLREEDSNFRPLGYEPSKLPLLYPTIYFLSSFQTLSYDNVVEKVRLELTTS